MPAEDGQPGSSGVSLYNEYAPGESRPLTANEINALPWPTLPSGKKDPAWPARAQAALGCPPGPLQPPDPPRLWSRAQDACFSCEGGACYSSSLLSERRKYEILQYKNPSLGTTKKEAWSRAVRGRGRFGKRQWATQGIKALTPATATHHKWNTRPDCLELVPGGRILQVARAPAGKQCWPVSNSDVPPSISGTRELCRVPEVPLTRYAPRRYYSAGGTKWPQFGWAPGMLGFPRGKSGQR